MKKRISDQVFIKTWQRYGSPAEVSKALGIDVRGVYKRRAALEAKGVDLSTVSKMAGKYASQLGFEKRREVSIDNGVVLIGSDAHFWPGEPSLAFQGFLALCKELNPKLVILNGDILDAPTVTRHEPPGYRYQPTLKEEIEVLQDRLDAIVKAAPNSQYLRTLGNHDIRFERHLAVHAPQYAGIPGTSLSDHIPGWPCSWTILLNGHTMVRHRHVAGGIHSGYQSTLRAGMSYVHGHLHKLQVTALSDYNGTRFGVDCGTLADPDADEAFDYVEDAPHGWRSGFAVLTFRNGRLMWPEVCYVDRGEAIYRDQVVA